MKKVCIIESNKILRDYFSSYYKDKFNLSFLQLDEFNTMIDSSFTEHDKIIVDISRYGKYINFCSEVLNKYLDHKKLALLANRRQREQLLMLDLEIKQIVCPESINDLELFLSI